ncbi:type 1 glutamine amidotransferase [Cytophagaceae bacterium ABcell3]|nr:type 1 glutamine amidotransferase [Cytophagaceae bacterium ABcell3]
MKSWVKSPENKVTATKFYEDHRLPFIDICEMLIIMGGPMGVCDDKKYPWLVQEKQFIEKAIAKGKKVIGICLGAQLIADVLGAKVYKNAHKEIGWHNITLTEKALASPLFQGFNKDEKVFQWHGDTFDIPTGATNIASSEVCQHQGFVYKNQVLALQFHLESTEKSIEKLIEHCHEELTEKDSFIQSSEQIKEGIEQNLGRNNTLMQLLYNRVSNGY